MALLTDYAITPDVFDSECYQHQAECGPELRNLLGPKSMMFNAGIIRNLRNGEWLSAITRGLTNPQANSSVTARKLILALNGQGRLRKFRPTQKGDPASNSDWCNEAIRTDKELPFRGGVIVTRKIKNDFQNNPLVAPVDQLDKADWYMGSSESVHLESSTFEEQRQHLGLILRHSRSLMFVDPYIDLGDSRYVDQNTGEGFVQLIKDAVKGRDPMPQIEIHRVGWVQGNNKDPNDPENREYRQSFKNAFQRMLGDIVNETGVQIKIVVWKESFRNRYLISNLCTIQMGHGYARNPAADDYARLSQKDARNWQRYLEVPAQEGGGKFGFVESYEVEAN